jgi:hypothetical protein
MLPVKSPLAKRGVTGRPLAVAGQCICTHVIVHWSLIGRLTVICVLVTGPWKVVISLYVSAQLTKRLKRTTYFLAVVLALESTTDLIKLLKGYFSSV